MSDEPSREDMREALEESLVLYRDILARSRQLTLQAQLACGLMLTRARAVAEELGDEHFDRRVAAIRMSHDLAWRALDRAVNIATGKFGER